MTPSSSHTAKVPMLLLIIYLSSQPLSTDAYLPALPNIGQDLSASPFLVQLTLSVFIAGFACAQLIAGPLSDRFGRRPITIAGCSLFLVAQIGCALAPNLDTLIVMRFIQALGVCCLVVCSRAMVRDCYGPSEGTGVMAKALAWMGLAPLLGPSIGGFIMNYAGWRYIFVCLTVLALLLLIATLRGLPETNQRLNPDALRPRYLLRNYLAIAKKGEFWAFASVGAASYCALFSFISGSPYLVINVLNQPEWVFGVVFGVATIGFIGGTILLQQMLPRVGIRRTLYGAATLSCVSGLTLAAVNVVWPPSLTGLLLPMMGVMIAHGLLNATAQVAAIGPFPEKAGAAAALNGFQIHAFGALLGMWIGYSYNGTMLPLTLTIALMTVLIAVFTATLVTKYAR